MADTARSSAVLKTYFETGDTPTQQQFADWLTSYANLVDFNTLTDTETAITAHAGGGQGSAYALTKYYSAIGTVATTGDSVLLPSALKNRSGVVINYSANVANIYPVSGQEIDGLGVNTPVSLPPGYTMFYYCLFNSEWYFEMKALSGISVSQSFSTTSASSITPNLQFYKFFSFGALAASLTINAPTSIFGDGQTFSMSIKDNGTSRTLSWNSIFRGIATALPPRTIVSSTMYFTFTYNAVSSKWDLISFSVQGSNQFTEAYLMISQAGTANPVITVLQNNTGLTFTALRDGAGIYEITPSSLPALDKTFVTMANNTPDPNFISFTTDTGDVFWALNTYISVGTGSDDILNRCCLHIRIFP